MIIKVCELLLWYVIWFGVWMWGCVFLPNREKEMAGILLVGVWASSLVWLISIVFGGALG